MIILAAFLISVRDDIEATIIEQKLKTYQIPVIRKYQESGGYMKIIMGVTMLGIDLYVPEELLETAQNILKEENEPQTEK